MSSIIGKRSHDYAGMTQEEKISTGASISQMMPKILALAEAYPDLKANANFQNLSMQLERMEEDIANSRKYYNGAVKPLRRKNIRLYSLQSGSPFVFLCRGKRKERRR